MMIILNGSRVIVLTNAPTHPQTFSNENNTTVGMLLLRGEGGKEPPQLTEWSSAVAVSRRKKINAEVSNIAQSLRRNARQVL